MDTERLVGIAAFIITMAYMGFGIPSQIKKNYTEQSVKGLSLRTNIFMFLSCVVWVLYAAVKVNVDWFILVPNATGGICALIILLQFYLYRQRSI